MRLTAEALAELRAKYVEMLSMRLADDAADPADGAAERVKDRMRRLAQRFPGALREIDELPLAEIRRRIKALDTAIAGAGEVERWMEAVALFHALTRGALVAKRWLGRRKRIDDAVGRAYAQALGALPFPEDSRCWADDLQTLASPPRGRLLDAVFAREARQMGLPVAVVRGLVFGRRRSRGKASGQ